MTVISKPCHGGMSGLADPAMYLKGSNPQRGPDPVTSGNAVFSGAEHLAAVNGYV